AARECVQSFERSRYLVGVVGKIVDHGYFICGSHDLQSPTDATELAEMGRCGRESHAAGRCGTQSGKCVGHIMQPWNFQVHLDDLTGLSRLHLKSDSSRRSNRWRRYEVGLRRIQTVGDCLL